MTAHSISKVMICERCSKIDTCLTHWYIVKGKSLLSMCDQQRSEVYAVVYKDRCFNFEDRGTASSEGGVA